jgi:hypothetical protein
VFFADQTPESIIDAVERFEALGGAITPEACRANAMRFGEAVFRDAMKALVARQGLAR